MWWEPERAENGEAADSSEFQGHRDLLFKTVEEVMPESCLWRCDVCHTPRTLGMTLAEAAGEA